MVGNSQSQQLLDKCRRLMTGRLRRSLSMVMHQLNESLFEMAFNQGGDVTGSRYFERIREIQFRKREFSVRFENRLAASFERFSVEARRTEATSVAAAAQHDVDIPACAALVHSRCARSLLELDRRLQTLVGGSATPGNPMSPEVVYEAFHHACNDLSDDHDIRPLLLVLFEQHIAGQLQQIYRDANALLEREGVYAGGGTAAGPKLSAESDRGEQITGFWIGAQIQKLIADRDVPDFVREFVFITWHQVLETAFRHRGETSLEWKKAKQTLSDLLDSVQPVSDAEQQRHVMRMLPGLLIRLKIGMHSAGLPVADQNRFLAALKEHQMSCVHRRHNGE